MICFYRLLDAVLELRILGNLSRTTFCSFSPLFVLKLLLLDLSEAKLFTLLENLIFSIFCLEDKQKFWTPKSQNVSSKETLPGNQSTSSQCPSSLSGKTQLRFCQLFTYLMAISNSVSSLIFLRYCSSSCVSEQEPINYINLLCFLSASYFYLQIIPKILILKQ